MSGLREKIADALTGLPPTAIYSDGTIKIVVEPVADAVLRVLAEHGDTQQVREGLVVDLANLPGAYVDHHEHWRVDHPVERVVDAVMAIVAPHLAERDAAVEQAKKAKRWLIDAAGADVTDLLQSLDDCTARAEHAEADLAAARQQLEQVRALHTDLLSAAERNLHGNDAAGDAYQNAADALLVILDVPARPAGHDESGQ